MRGQLIDHLVANFVGEEEMVFMESRIFQFLKNELQILRGRSDEVYCFKMWEFFGGVVDFLDQVDIIFV